MTQHAERRTSVRLPAVPNRSVLEWWPDSRHYKDEARLLDISLGGALIQAEALPPIGHPVWFHVEFPASSSWVLARIVRLDGPRRAALRFEQPCPWDVLMAATLP